MRLAHLEGGIKKSHLIARLKLDTGFTAKVIEDMLADLEKVHSIIVSGDHIAPFL